MNLIVRLVSASPDNPFGGDARGYVVVAVIGDGDYRVAVESYPVIIPDFQIVSVIVLPDNIFFEDAGKSITA